MQCSARSNRSSIGKGARPILSGLLLLAALAACTDRPTAPGARSLDLRRIDARAVDSSGSGTYLVLSRPGGFASSLDSGVAALGGTLQMRHDAAGLAVVGGLSADAAARLASRGDVADVAPDATVSLESPAAPVEADVTDVATPTIASQANPTLASLYGWQWDMQLIGANTAWAAGKLGDPSVTVAIIDSGIDYDAPDLNGLVDLSRSVSFVPSDDQFRATYFPTRHAISDFHGHGTNVASQVSSKARAFAGVTSKTTLIGVKVLGWTGSGSLGAILNGVLWSADHGADVANLSLGAVFAKPGLGRYVAEFQRVFNYANEHGMVVVAAAGNSAADLDHDGNAFEVMCSVVHMVCVSSVGPALAGSNPDAPAYYTNYGRSAISVAAPGGNAAQPLALSAWPWGSDVASWVWSYCSKTRFAGLTKTGVPILTSCQAGNRITGYIGTSQASPHVAGLAALLVAEHGHGQPQLIQSIIEGSAVDLGTPGTDPFYGRGRISVARALGL